MRLFFSCALILALSVAPPILHAHPVILHNLSGESIPFNTLKGKWVFINYWASWCDACLAEIKELNQFYAAYHEHIALFAVNYEELNRTEQQLLSKKFHLNYPSLAADPGESLELGQIEALPVTFVFDPHGQLHETIYGGLTAKHLTQYLSRLKNY